MRKLWTKREISIIKKHYPESDKDYIIKILPRRTWTAILRAANKLGLKRKFKGGDIGHIHLSKMDNLLKDTPITYYWIGFLMADGHFDHNSNTIGIEISIKDFKHLKKLAKILNVPLHKRVRVLKYKGNIKKFEMVSIAKSDAANFKKIIKKFDIRKNKTQNPPLNMRFKNKALFLSFLIGYIDGDGCISKSSGHSYKCTIECHYSWKPFLIKILNKFGGIIKSIPPNVYISKRGNTMACISRMAYLFFLKNKSKEFNLPILKRKWDKLDTWKQSKFGNPLIEIGKLK